MARRFEAIYEQTMLPSVAEIKLPFLGLCYVVQDVGNSFSLLCW